MSDSSATKRLNKWISETGICSRREADKLIAEGQVRVNGQPAEMGLQVGASDQIEVRGQLLTSKPDSVYLAYNKPVGITCTTERKVRGNIVDAVNYEHRIFPIGRLDKPSEGLILLTNDGDIVNKILRAGNEHEKEYIVTLERRFDDEFLQQMRRGVPILDTVTRQCKADRINGRTFRIVLTQGLNRQIRRMAEYLGYEVVKLKRVRIMHIDLGELAVGEWRQLAGSELRLLEQKLQHSIKTEDTSKQRSRGNRSAVKKTKSKPANTSAGFRSRKR
ncbi:23S rRNA pseudouridine(2604) synthase RluF [Aliidiomarina minuta]|uniref:Pseudouridine synthase n=1 Tax=Aliidiomarina minuta TaxID=880057 RepID=A0A432W9X2_9GAMM|nr:23S rRNA pseudouridine(2604) synthase RluF [Aliidiomarina minuta]RUO26957.1 23S rRNA pseudouridine(2604) synthase RluF [Aliidiomarina minuta]